jgi:CheY-like chemotaxis protein
MKRAREIALIAVLLGSLSGVLGADTSEREKSLPEGGLIGRIRKEEEAKRKHAGSDLTSISDPDAAQRELEGLHNTVSNALRVAEQTKRAEEASGGVLGKVVIAAGILGAGIILFGKFGPKIGFLHKVSDDEAYARANNSAEEKSFSEFVAAFKVGPPREPRYSAEAASGSEADEPLEVGESRLTAPGPLEVFFDSAPISVAIMRGLIQEITRASEQDARHNLLAELCEKVSELKRTAGPLGVLPVWQLAAALEGLVKQLSDRDQNVTASTLRTVASAVDLLEGLTVPGIESELISSPALRLLAVDDDALSRHAVSFALKKALNKPDLAENGEAAMALVSHIKYDAIFLDVQMPGMDGFETCTKIHGTELNRETPVVFVTCQSDFDARAKSTLSGGNDLIGKPFLTFEITVKALTLAFRGRMNRQYEFVPRPEPETHAADVKITFDEPRMEAPNPDDGETTGAVDDSNATAEQVEALHEPAKEHAAPTELDEASAGVGSYRHGAPTELLETVHGHNACARGDEALHEPDVKIQTPMASSSEPPPIKLVLPTEEKEALEPVHSPHAAIGSCDSADAVVKAFFTHAPGHVRTLRIRLEQVGTVAESERQERLVDLYLAVHSFRAEAELAKSHPVVQLSSALEARLKRLLEGAQNCGPDLTSIREALDLLGHIFASKAGADLAHEPATQVLSLGEDIRAMVAEVASRLNPEQQQTALAMPGSSPAVDLVEAAK